MVYYNDIIGKYLTYNGRSDYAKDNITKELMNRNLVIGHSYKVDGVCYNGYYVIDCCYYPKESFYIDNKKYMKYKYNLK